MRILCLICFFLSGTALTIAETRTNPKAKQHAQTLNTEALHAMDIGNYTEAVAIFLRARDEDPNNASIWYNLASVYLLIQQPTNAETILREAIKKFPQDITFLARLGDAYFSQKNFSAAKDAYQSALNHDPDQTQTALRLVSTLILLKEKVPAQDLLDRLAKNEVQDAPVLGAIAGLYLASGALQKGIAAAERSIALKPSYGAYMSLGSGLEIRGDMQEALNAYRHAAKLAPASEELIAKITQLEQTLTMHEGHHQ